MFEKLFGIAAAVAEQAPAADAAAGEAAPQGSMIAALATTFLPLVHADPAAKKKRQAS